MAEQMASSPKWTHKSVREFAGDSDPVAAMIGRAQGLALDAMEAGWSGPPFDPIALAGHLSIQVFPRADVADARTVPEPDGALRIEYNPTRPRARVRYSIAHEIAHTLFPDCNKRVRHRQAKEDMRLDDWQLETLCNIGAAELLMPIGSLPRSTGDAISIDKVLEMRARFEVSVEAVLLRLVRITGIPCFVFACSRHNEQFGYQLDYAVTSKAWGGPTPTKLRIPGTSIVSDCAAIGFTAKGDEKWEGHPEPLHIEAVGVQPIPEIKYPRVLGIAASTNTETGSERIGLIKFLRGDALSPRGVGAKLILHVVNDKTPNWGGGFAQSLRRKWPEAQQEFQEWTATHRADFHLGAAHFVRVTDDIHVGHLISQKGYGPSSTPRIRYAALRTALHTAAEFAQQHNSTVHIPRIGCGQAGGNWDVVEELIADTLNRRGISVTVYDLPTTATISQTKPALLFG